MLNWSTSAQIQSEETVTSPAENLSRFKARVASFVALALSVAEVDPAAVEAAARRLGESRRLLAPLAWAAGTLVLLIRGIRLLIVNWRLSLLQLIPAAWIWLATWDLKEHALRGSGFRHFHWPGAITFAIVILFVTYFSFWCNTVFALALDGPHPPRIAPAIRLARKSRQTTWRWGMTVGIALVFAAVVMPRTGRLWLFSTVLTAVIVFMTVTFVAVPARILGIQKQKLPPKEKIGRVAAAGALSAVAMSPGFLLARIGLLMLGVKGLHVLGFILLSIGSALYAAGMSSVKVVKMSMKLTPASGADTATATADERTP